MTARIDASQVVAFERRLEAASRFIEEEGDKFEEKWGEELADGMRATVAVGDKAPHLRDQIEQVEPGGITLGGPEFDYWRHLERGTAHMAPQPFIRPAMQRIRKPATEDAGKRAVKLIARG